LEQQSHRFSTSATSVTRLIILANVAVFVVMVLAGVSLTGPTSRDLVNWGADFGPLTLNGQWWRVVACMFLHIGIIHIAFNMYALYGIGELLERLLGKFGFAVLYLLSGVGGSLASLYWNPHVVSAGASGAIFGLYGGLIAFLLVHRHVIPAAALKPLASSAGGFVLFNMVFGAAVPGIDMSAHIGGLAAGVIVGLALTQSMIGATAQKRTRRAALALTVGGIVMVLIAARIAGVSQVRDAAASESGAEARLPGAMWGTVTDPSGAGIRGVAVMTVDAKRKVRTAATGNDGTYRFDDLPPGNYGVMFTARGFKEAAVPSVTVEPNRGVVVDRELEPGVSDPAKE
jgi:rhomboid protease GluP